MSMGLDANNHHWSLLGFNLGIELGQAAFLGAVLVVLSVVHRWHRTLTPARIRRPASVFALVMGGNWLVERLTA